MGKTRALAIIFFLLISLFAFHASAAGVCINPCAPDEFICSAVPVDSASCCGSLANPSLCPSGLRGINLGGNIAALQTYGVCTSQFFQEDTPSDSVAQCTSMGCCCSQGNVYTTQASCPIEMVNNNPSTTSFIAEADPQVDCASLCASASTPVVFSADCNSPSFDPALYNFTAHVVKGKRQVILTWNAACTANQYEIFRKCIPPEGTPESQNLCVDDEEHLIKTLFNPSSRIFTDEDPALGWGMNYEYRLVPHYLHRPEAPAATTKVGMGDLECEGQLSDEHQFCISEEYYEQYENYLSEIQQKDFEAYRDARLQTREGGGFRCSPTNILTQVQAPCGTDQFCVSRPPANNAPSVARCVSGEDCDLAGFPVGIGASANSCHTGPNGAPRFCYYDNSKTSVNGCFNCELDGHRIECADYKSKSACEFDACGSGSVRGGSCVWEASSTDVGTGVCRNTKENNCALCSRALQQAVDSAFAYNFIFDACSERKFQILDGKDLSCFLDDDGTPRTCNDVVCSDFSVDECGSYTIDNDNKVTVTSSNHCSIPTCRSSGTRCFKDADGLRTPTRAGDDCAGLNDEEKRACELDYFPPTTRITANTGPAGNADFLFVEISDQKSPSGTAVNFLETSEDYRTFFCIAKASNSKCTLSFSSPSVSAAGKKSESEPVLPLLHFFGTDLIYGLGEEAQVVLRDVEDGDNLLRFFTLDPSNNLEPVKEIRVSVLRDAAMPTGEITVDAGTRFGDKWYTRNKKPLISVNFDKIDSIVSFSLFSQATGLPVDVVVASPLRNVGTGGFGWNIKYTTTQDLPDGNYIFRVIGKITDGAQSPPVSALIKVDTTPPQIRPTIEPAQDSTVQEDPVEILIPFNEEVNLTNVKLNLDAFDPFTFTQVEENFTSSGLFSKDFRGTFHAGDGEKIVVISAKDVAGNALENAQHKFIIHNNAASAYLIAPPFGVTADRVLDLKIGSTSKATCNYSIDRDVAPRLKLPFDAGKTAGFIHEKDGFTMTSDSHRLFLLCEDNVGIARTVLNLAYDPTAPVIIKAEAAPSEVIEYTDFNAQKVQTTIHVFTDDVTRCKFSSTPGTLFADMEGKFPGFDEEIFKTQHSAIIELLDFTETYTYAVMCENRALKATSEKLVTFSVNVETGLKILEITTPPAINITGVDIGVKTNKQSQCVFNVDNTGDITLASVNGYDHSLSVDIRADGIHNVTYTCAFIGEGADSVPQSASKIKQIVVDTTPPDIAFVDVDGNLSEDGTYKVQHKRSIIKARWNATDPGAYYGTPFAKIYYYRVVNSFSDELMRNWTENRDVNKFVAITNLNLSVGERYRVEVMAQDTAGNLQEEIGSSIDLLVDVSGAPAHCTDGSISGDETGTDCGGSCEPCASDASCSQNSDCSSGLCNAGVCADSSSTCSNGIQDGLEAGPDCGGSCSTLCATGASCFVNSDCVTNYCDPLQSICAVHFDPCQNGQPDVGEIGTDCGGSCSTKCPVGSGCEADLDCATRNCVEFKCSEPLCDNSKVDGDETDTDCGGVCDSCSTGAKCNIDEDCFQTSCVSGFCGGVPAEATEDRTALKGLDTDGDGLSDYDELYSYGTDPTNTDTDADGYSDYDEVTQFGTDPADPESVPGGSGFSWILLFLSLVIIASGVVYYGYTQYYVPPKKPQIPLGLPPRQPPVGPTPSKPLTIPILSNLKKNKQDAQRKEMFKAFEHKEPLKEFSKPTTIVGEAKKPTLEKTEKSDAFKELKDVASEKKQSPGKGDVFDELSSVNKKKGEKSKDALEDLSDLAKKGKKKK